MAKTSTKVAEPTAPVPTDKVCAGSKYTIKDALAIRAAYKKGISIFEIADMADMNAVMARDIAVGRLFK